MRHHIESGEVSSKFIDHPVHDRLFFAERRMNELAVLNGGDLGGALPRDRQQLVQEFFFHLCGSIDFLAQKVNEERALGLAEEKVSVPEVLRSQHLKSKDCIRGPLAQLHPPTRNKPLPNDPYSEEASHFRIILFRNYVSHIRPKPFSFSIAVGSDIPGSAHFFLDPRLPPGDPFRFPSKLEAIDEMRSFLVLVTAKCNQALKELGIL